MVWEHFDPASPPWVLFLSVLPMFAGIILSWFVFEDNYNWQAGGLIMGTAILGIGEFVYGRRLDREEADAASGDRQ